MTNARKLLARLNAANCRFDIGRGGIPELTPQDIAGALGMIEDAFARDVFTAVWWPDGGRLRMRALDAAIGALQFGEWRERAERLTDAQLTVAQAELGSGRVIAEAHAMLDRARAAMWPALCEPPYAAIRKAVLHEIASPRHCSTCSGRGQVKAGELVMQCAACEGSGTSPTSDRRRAWMIERDESAYRKRWKEVYEWTFAKVSEAEREGAREFAIRVAA